MTPLWLSKEALAASVEQSALVNYGQTLKDIWAGEGVVAFIRTSSMLSRQELLVTAIRCCA